MKRFIPVILTFIMGCSIFVKKEVKKEFFITYTTFLPDSIKGISIVRDDAIPVEWYLYYPESISSLSRRGDIIISAENLLTMTSPSFMKKIDSIVELPILITNSTNFQHFVKMNIEGMRVGFLNFQNRGEIPVKRALGKYLNIMRNISDVVIGINGDGNICDNFDICLDHPDVAIRIILENGNIKEMELEEMEHKGKQAGFEMDTLYKKIEEFIEKHGGTFIVPEGYISPLSPLMVMDSLPQNKDIIDTMIGSGTPYYKPYQGESGVKFYSELPWVLEIRRED